jgi:rSAM/selenodomain-associated transferase 1
MLNQQTLIIFTRYPEAGKTKTRLIPALGEKGAADFQRQMTEKTIIKARKLNEKIPVNIEVHFTGGNQKLMQKWLGNGLIFKEQKGRDLGAKMLSAFQEILSKNQQKVVIIGIDCPDLNESILQEAFEACENNDLVIGKALDGGYYLIGLNRLVSELFEGIKWGSSKVFSQTENIAKKLNLKMYRLPILNDIDRPEDLTFC